MSVLLGSPWLPCPDPTCVFPAVGVVLPWGWFLCPSCRSPLAVGVPYCVWACCLCDLSPFPHMWGRVVCLCLVRGIAAVPVLPLPLASWGRVVCLSTSGLGGAVCWVDGPRASDPSLVSLLHSCFSSFSSDVCALICLLLILLVCVSAHWMLPCLRLRTWLWQFPLGWRAAGSVFLCPSGPLHKAAPASVLASWFAWLVFNFLLVPLPSGATWAVA